jgi:hypothetical protein
MGLKEQYSVGFPNQTYEGCVVKALPPPWGAGLKLASRDAEDGYRVVWIRRPDVDRWNSFLTLHKKAYKKVKTMADVHMELRTVLDDTGSNRPMNERVEINAAYCEGRAADTLAVMKQRRDMEVVEISYAAVCNDPLGVFAWMQDIGWPITAWDAAQIPKRTQR